MKFEQINPPANWGEKTDLKKLKKFLDETGFLELKEEINKARKEPVDNHPRQEGF